MVGKTCITLSSTGATSSFRRSARVTGGGKGVVNGSGEGLCGKMQTVFQWVEESRCGDEMNLAENDDG